MNSIQELRHVTKISDLTADQVSTILDRAEFFQREHEKGVRREDKLHGRVIALVFEKPSLRTKVTFEVAATYLGGHPVFLSSEQIFASGNNQRGRESIPDIARNLERFSDAIVARVFKHSTIQTLAQTVSVPVINALCDEHHPSQALTDIMTMEQALKSHNRALTVAYVGDGNNVAVSLMQACAMRGHSMIVASPEGYQVPVTEQVEIEKLRTSPSQQFAYTRDPLEAVANADVIYTDTFVSMGQEDETAKRLKDFDGYQVNAELMSKAPKHAVFMHCLPAHRGEEVTDEVMDSKASIVFDQAACRLHVAKALLSWSLRL